MNARTKESIFLVLGLCIISTGLALGTWYFFKHLDDGFLVALWGAFGRLAAACVAVGGLGMLMGQNST